MVIVSFGLITVDQSSVTMHGSLIAIDSIMLPFDKQNTILFLVIFLTVIMNGLELNSMTLIFFVLTRLNNELG